ncbi:nucleotide sugar dehydrogenase [Streptomyces sp. CB02115]|uniref:nucleotide sugar dehydrogenase n=1 Tax=Streptomyces sp. CB02115 TaxID=1703939 RepID=UPI000AE191B8|nr:nucleotide sugar dehydrogenase [Streptomyces sp. CB02115]
METNALNASDSGGICMDVVIMGQGYVGLPLAVHAAEAGHHVVAYDTDVQRVKQLTVGETYIGDMSGARVKRLMESGLFHPTANPDEIHPFDVGVIAVPTPLVDGVPDLGHVESATVTLARWLRPGATVVLESTTYPGTTRNVVGALLEEHSGLTVGADFHLGFSPERIDPGNSTWRLSNTPKLVAGIDDRSLGALSRFYGSFVDTVVPVPGCEEAEFAKILENTFRHVNVALVNELAAIGRDLGIDVWSAIDAAATKPFGFMRFTPGPGVGGHCLPIDPQYLSWHARRTLHRSSRFVELADEVNAGRPAMVVERVIRGLNSRKLAVNGARVLVLGLSYKKNVGDTRESPSARVISGLAELGADLRLADPHVPEDSEVAGSANGATRVGCVQTELAAADITVLLTDHDSFDYAEVAEHARYVLDCRHRMPKLDHIEYL